jgi:Uma2 family endonuclease
LGEVFNSEAGYRCFPHRPRLLRKPDVSFVVAGRFPGGQVPAGELRIAPDLAVEVVSPNDLAEAVQEKVADYLKAGVRLIWLVYPAARMAVVYQPSGPSAWVFEEGELDGGDVIPGFRCRLADVLLRPRPTDDAGGGAAVGPA